jgi:hypothetical protein
MSTFDSQVFKKVDILNTNRTHPLHNLNEVYEQFAILAALVLAMQYVSPIHLEKKKEKNTKQTVIHCNNNKKRIIIKCHFHLSLF